ncbi:MAG: hypothetical protein IJB00_04680 [Akkermansia sp.]|nr:hypothetical protein [Akkermansia sp.]
MNIPWNIALGLIVVAFILPFIFLHSQMTAQRKRSRSDHDELEHLRTMLRDLEEHVRKDKSLFLEALGVPFLLIRRSGRLVMTNSAAAHQLGIDGTHNANLLRTLPDCPLRELIQQAVRCTKPESFTFSTSRKGDESIYRAKATPLQTEEKLIGIVFHDITELHRTQIIRRDFVANASHELRTPLTIIRGYLESLTEDDTLAADPHARSHALLLMKKHADRIVRLVEDMLTISRLENAEKAYLRMEDFVLRDTAQEVLTRLEMQAQAQGATIKTDFPADGLPLHGDKFYWAQVLFNLMENALKNNPAPGLCVTLIAQYSENGAVITVRDNGEGIPAAHVPFIFNRFYRANKSSAIKGTGLGLSIVRHAVEAHGGRITVESYPGRRTDFTITLPLRHTS